MALFSLQVFSDAETHYTVRRDQLSELNSQVQTLSSQAEQFEHAQNQTFDEAREGLVTLSNRSQEATEEFTGVVLQTQTAVEEGVGGLEKVRVQVSRVLRQVHRAFP